MSLELARKDLPLIGVDFGGTKIEAAARDAQSSGSVSTVVEQVSGRKQFFCNRLYIPVG